MEKELKIVFSVFLAFFIYGLTSFFQSGVFLTPLFLSKITLVVVALILAILNLKTAKNYLLWYCFVSSAFFALTDNLTIGFLDQYFTTTYFNNLSNSEIFLVVTFVIYFSFHLAAIILFYLATNQKLISIGLAVILALGILLIFTSLDFYCNVIFSIYFILFFILAQRGSEQKNKILRVISYQYLLLVLLGFFEYFI